MSVLEEVKRAYICTACSDATQTLGSISEDIQLLKTPSSLEDCSEQIKLAESLLEQAQQVEAKASAYDLKELLEGKFKSKIENWEQEEYDINTKYEDLLDSKITSLEEEARDINEKKKLELNESNQIYFRLEEKRKQLESYSDDIIEICAANGVTTADVDIDNSSFTVEELDVIYDQYLTFVRSRSSKINFVSLFRQKVQNPFAQVAVVLFIIISAICLKLLWNIEAFLVVAALVRDQLVQKKKEKSYIVLYGLVFNIRPMEMGFKGEVDENELVSEQVDENSDERLNTIAEEWQQVLEEHDKKNPNNDLEEERVLLAGSIKEIQSEFDNVINTVYKSKATAVEVLNKKLAALKKDFEERKSKLKLLGQEVSKSGVLDTNFVLGCRDDVFEETMDIGLQNIIIRPTADLELHKKFLLVLMANALTKVSAGNINVIVCDPNRQGQELISFYHPDLEDVIRYSSDNLDKIIQELREFAESNLKAMKGMDITSFNMEAEKTGRTTRDYRLLIVLSQPDKMEEDEALGEFMKFSANLGVIVWLVSNKTMPDTKIFNKPFEGVRNPYQINVDTFGPAISDMLAEAVRKGANGGLLWKDYVERTIKDSDIWAYNGDGEIELRPGFLEGDPTKFKGYPFGNVGDVHMLGVGGTGAGKSVFLNFLICETTLRYDPRSYELWLVDYKGNEFSKYMSKEGHPDVLPHMKACLCTSDGDYAGSLFTALAKICEDRFSMLKQNGFKNMKQWNEKVRAKASAAHTEEEREAELSKLIPRILCINDEFQVIFQKAEDKIVTKLMTDITYISKLGRAAGVHLFFTSQSMTGTLKADTLDQFTLRFALRCEESVSQQILGCNLAGKIRQRNGYLYVKCFQDKKVEQIKKYRTPFLQDEGPDEQNPNKFDELQAHIDRMAALAREKGIPKKDVITYQESTVHGIEDMEAFYNKAENIPDNFFLLGERMTYSQNKAPENVILSCANNNHIFSAFEDMRDLVNFYKSIMFNISKQEDADVLINSQVADLHYLCELDKDVPEDKQFLSTEKSDPKFLFKNIYEPVLQARTENKKKDTPLYIILIGWDKARGVGVDKDATLMSNLTVFLQTCGEYNIHVIFIGSGTGQIPASLISACKYSIAGKVNESDSYKLLDNKQASKSYEGLKNGYMFIRRGSVVTRAKIYQSELTREIQAAEFVM